MATIDDYSQDAVEAARSVLIECGHLLGEYRESVVLVGGWVPAFILPGAQEDHIGSTDVDLALDHRSLQDAGYQKIEKLLLGAGYAKTDQPFRFLKTVKGMPVYVDLLAGEYSGTGKKKRHQQIQDLKARKARGCDLAFKNPVEIRIDGTLPSGDLDSVRIRVASVVSFIVMKGMALAGRMKPKDSYDIYFCVTQYPGGFTGLAAEFKELAKHPLVLEALGNIRDKFSTDRHVGPIQVSQSYDAGDEEMERIRRDAFEKINAFLDLVDGMKLD